MKTVHVVIVCVTLLLGVVVWRLTDHGGSSGVATETRPKINVAAIERVLAEDSHTADNFTTVEDVVQRMRAIDISQCPTDFQQAYIAHIGAWEKMLLVEWEARQWKERYDSDDAMVEAFLRGLVFDFGIIGESEEARNRVLAMYQKASQDIQSTFSRVQQIAVGYGARLPSK